MAYSLHELTTTHRFYAHVGSYTLELCLLLFVFSFVLFFFPYSICSFSGPVRSEKFLPWSKPRSDRKKLVLCTAWLIYSSQVPRELRSRDRRDIWRVEDSWDGSLQSYCGNLIMKGSAEAGG